MYTEILGNVRNISRLHLWYWWECLISSRFLGFFLRCFVFVFLIRMVTSLAMVLHWMGCPAGFASKPLQECNLKNLETLLLEPLKTMKSCPIKTMKTCLSLSHQAKPKKAASGAHPKRQSPSRFCVQAIAGVQPQKSRNVAFGTPKNNEIVPEPLRNFCHQAKPKKAASGAHPKRQSPSRFCVQAIAELQPQKSRNVAFGTPKNKEIVPQPLRNFSHQAKPKKAASGAHPKRQSPSRFCVQAIAELQPQKSRNVAFGTPKNNEIVPQPLRNCSHQAKPKKAASGAHPKRQSPSRFCVQAIAGVQPQKSRNVAFGTPKNNENVPQPLRGSATRQSVRKLRRERIRKGRAPAGFASKPLQERNLKNLETLFLEPLKTMKSCPIKNNENVPQPLRNVRHQAKPKKAASGAHPKGRAPAGFASKPLQECSLNENVPQPLRRERIRKGRAQAAFASKPLQECNLKNLETLLLEPLKTMKSCPIKTMTTCLSHCETSATRQSLRKLRRERIRKGRAPAGFASKPLQECSLKNLETLRLEPLKTMKSCPSHCETSATRQSLRKLRRERIRKGRAPAGFASKPLRNCNLKNLETLLLEPL